MKWSCFFRLTGISSNHHRKRRHGKEAHCTARSPFQFSHTLKTTTCTATGTAYRPWPQCTTDICCCAGFDAWVPRCPSLGQLCATPSQCWCNLEKKNHFKKQIMRQVPNCSDWTKENKKNSSLRKHFFFFKWKEEVELVDRDPPEIKAF